MKILVTGASGMLATNIIDVLLKKGYAVRGLLRCRESYKGVISHSLELVEGNFTCVETAEQALEGCDAVIHPAAIIAQNLLRYEDYVHVNVDATEQLLALAGICHIKKFVYVSSANTIGCGTAEEPGTEITPCGKPLRLSFYGRSKAAAERLVVEAGGVVVNPTFMLGRYGSLQGSNQIMRMARRITICPPGGKNFIDVEDAARGVVAAMERGRNGEKYLIAGGNLLYKDFFRRFPQVRHVIVIPRWILLAAGSFGSIARILGVKTSLSFTNARILCLPGAYDSSKARLELDFHPGLKNISTCFL